MTARVSIVVPAFNNAEHIEATMRSIIAQSFTDLEIIVADHGSTDATVARLQQFLADPRVTLLQTEAGGGAARNWNRVTDAATAPLLKLVCGDDLLYPDIVARQVEAFDDGVVLVASGRDIVDARAKPVFRNRGINGLAGRRRGGFAVRRTVRDGLNSFGEPACVMIRRSVLQSVGGWAHDEQYLIDEATYVKVLFEGDFVGIPVALAAFRLSAEQWSVRLGRDQASQATAFHRALLARRPDVVSRSDVRIGNLRARVNAVSRRAVYALLGQRMTGVTE